MALAKDKWSLVVAKLIQKTQSKRLKWQRLKLRIEGGSGQVTSAFQTIYKEKGLRIYKLDLGDTGLVWNLANMRNKRISLEIIDAAGQPIWTFPESESVADLLSAIEYQAAGVDEFLDELLAD